MLQRQARGKRRGILLLEQHPHHVRAGVPVVLDESESAAHAEQILDGDVPARVRPLPLGQQLAIVERELPFSNEEAGERAA